jgi:hypothetical protein
MVLSIAPEFSVANTVSVVGREKSGHDERKCGGGLARISHHRVLTAVCHCLPQGKQCSRVAQRTASSKQWHTVLERVRLVRNAG